jgi:hypothetical protein
MRVIQRRRTTGLAVEPFAESLFRDLIATVPLKRVSHAR